MKSLIFTVFSRITAFFILIFVAFVWVGYSIGHLCRAIFSRQPSLAYPKHKKDKLPTLIRAESSQALLEQHNVYE